MAIPAVWPLFHDGLPNRVDRGLHLIRIALLDHNIRQGNLFPRWMPEMMLGRGYPLLTFYGAGVYYLSEIPALLGMSIYDSSVVTLVFLTLVAGFGMYLFAADLFSGFSRWVPLVAAVAYLYAPYFLITNLYMRGAIAEVMAQALMPWALWSLRRIFNSDQPARYAVATSLLVASIVYSHTLSILIFPPLVAAYLALLWWLSGWQRVRLLWALFAVASAVAITAFFWLPLILRRSDISDVGYAVALGSWLPNGTWDWRSFLDDDWQYFYRRSGQPPRFGLVQFLLAMSGAALAFVRGRNREVWFFAIVGLLASFLVGRWALPLWSSTEILQAIQHPYRLLSILSISTAILTGALVVYFPVARLRAIVAIAVIGLFIFANYPRLGLPLPVFARQNMLVTLPAVAQTEAEQGVEQGGELSSMVQEFRPRWAGQNLVYTGSADVVAPAMDVAITDANSVTTRMTVSNSAPASLHFNDFYFPGWQIVRNGQERLPIYASTNLGLLTVDLPPGTHQLTVRYAGGLPERIAGLISLFGLAVLASVAVRYRYYWLSAVPILLFIWGGVAMFYQPAPQPVQTPVSSWEESGLRLAGVRHKQASPNTLTLYPYWYVLTAQQPDVRFRWQLLDADGGIVAETLAYPYFNASTADTWPPGTLVDDAVQLAIPAGVDAGSYELALGLDTGTDGDGNTVPQVVASITLPGTPPETLIEGMNSTDAIYDELVRLKGFTVTADGRDLHFGDDDPPVVRHGEPVRYTLYWRALDAITENYHSYVHLNDSAGRSVAKQDQLPGPFFRPPKMWDKVQLQPDTHLLRIPDDAPGGLYWPSVGLYEFGDTNVLPASQGGEPVAGDNFRLPPIKIVGKASKPEHKLTAHFEDGFSLQGYSLHLPDEVLRPGDAFTVTLAYRNDEATGRDATRFVHLYNPELGLAAQFDSPPQDGINPTWSWMPGETITDQVRLTVAEDAQPGQYSLLLGFYDPQAGAVRLSVSDDDGSPFVDNVVPLQEIVIQSAP